MTTLQHLKDGTDLRLHTLVGRTAIVGIYQFYAGQPHKRSQVYGGITGIEDGLMVLNTQKDRFLFPGRYDAFVPAPRGKYRLETSGEEITDPDYLVSWRLDLADNPEESQWTANTAPHFESIVGVEWEFEYAHDPEYLEELIAARGNAIIGEAILIGMRRYATPDGSSRRLLEQTQIYGKVNRLSIAEGVVIELADGSEFKLPPDISLLQVPPPGEYKLRRTGEVIVNPDLLTMWTSEGNRTSESRESTNPAPR